MSDEMILKVVFFQTEAGREPVREWLKSLDQNDRKTIGEDVKLVQFRWPLGMPLVRKMENNLWEVRTRLGNRRRREFSLPSGVMKWPCYTVSSRNHRRHQPMN